MMSFATVRAPCRPTPPVPRPEQAAEALVARGLPVARSAASLEGGRSVGTRRRGTAWVTSYEWMTMVIKMFMTAHTNSSMNTLM
jgi:hypothetical protein